MRAPFVLFCFYTTTKRKGLSQKESEPFLSKQQKGNIFCNPLYLCFFTQYKGEKKKRILFFLCKNDIMGRLYGCSMSTRIIYIYISHRVYTKGGFRVTIHPVSFKKQRRSFLQSDCTQTHKKLFTFAIWRTPKRIEKSHACFSSPHLGAGDVYTSYVRFFSNKKGETYAVWKGIF